MNYDDLAEDEDERRFLRGASGGDVADDIALVRLVMRRRMANGHDMDVLKAAAVVGRLLEVRKRLTAARADNIQTDIDDALDDMNL